eukprot:6207939-Pyramimonas_sp.AAC.1
MRFRPPTTQDAMPVVDATCGKPIDPSKATPALLWAARFNRKWFSALRACKDMHSMASAHVLKLTSDGDFSSTCWILTNVHNRSGTLAKCILDTTGESFAVRGASPDTISSLHLFA